MQKCIDDCTDCHAVCLETMTYCLEIGESYAEPSHIKLISNTAKLCALLQDFLLQSTPHIAKLAQVCAESCSQCAESCDHFDDAALRACTKECRTCAESAVRIASGPKWQ